MINKTNYQVLISLSGEQVLRTTAKNSSTVIDIGQRTGDVTIYRRI